MDGRRSQWIAFDALFFGSTTCDRLLDEFGPAGVTVWLAYLCACKRNLVPGQISVLGDADTLAQLGLPGLPLVNSTGEEWTLDALWTQLGRAKNVSRRRRGRVTDIVCTRWGHWQKDLQRDQQAEKKRRSRLGNAGTKDGRSTDDSRTDKDIDKTGTSTGTRHTPSPHDDGDPGPVEPGGEAYVPTTFEAFWQSYPDHARQDRAGTRRAWNAATARGVSDLDMLRALEAWVAHWATVEPQFVPHSANWLKRARYETPPPPPATTKAEKRAAQTVTVLTEFMSKEEAS